MSGLEHFHHFSMDRVYIVVQLEMFFTNDHWLIKDHDLLRKYTRCIHESSLFVCQCQGQQLSHSSKKTNWLYTYPLTLKRQLAAQGRDFCTVRKFGFFLNDLFMVQYSQNIQYNYNSQPCNNPNLHPYHDIQLNK